MEYARHGGQCCGIGHVYGFDHSTEEDLLLCIQIHAEISRGSNRLLEAILTDRQLTPTADDRRVRQEVRDAGGWPIILTRNDFKLAEYFTNSNTGRVCYRFIRIETVLSGEEVRPPFWHNGVTIPAPIPRVFAFRRATIEVGNSVRVIGTEIVGEVINTTRTGADIRLLDGTEQRYRKTQLEVVELTILEGNPQDGGREPAPVDLSRPLYIRSFRENLVVPFILSRSEDDVFQGRAAEPLMAAGGRDLSVNFSYVTRTGDWAGGDVARVFNADTLPQVVVEGRAPAPAEPVPVLAEFFARFATHTSNRMFPTLQELRDEYPRVRNYQIRTIFSDGTITTSDVLPIRPR